MCKYGDGDTTQQKFVEGLLEAMECSCCLTSMGRRGVPIVAFNCGHTFCNRPVPLCVSQVVCRCPICSEPITTRTRIFGPLDGLFHEKSVSNCDARDKRKEDEGGRSDWSEVQWPTKRARIEGEEWNTSHLHQQSLEPLLLGLDRQVTKLGDMMAQSREIVGHRMISPHAGAATIASNTMLMEENQVLKKRNAEMLRENQQQRQRILQLLKNIDEVRNSFTLLVHAECAPLDTGSQDIETGKGLGVDGSNGAGSRKEEETLLRGDWNDDIGLTGRCLDEIDSQDAGSEKEETSGSCSIADESAAAQIHQRHMQLHVTDTCN
jgi:hypothetical protein